MSLLPCNPVGELSSHGNNNGHQARIHSRSRFFVTGQKVAVEKRGLLSKRYNSSNAFQVVQYGSFISGPANYFGAMTKTTNKEPGTLSIRTQALSSKSLSSLITPEIANINFFNRIILAWKILFPKTILVRGDSNAKIARQRLKMVLFSDRCSVSDLAKKKILENVVKTLSEFVDIESKDKVELNVSTDSDIGTLYSVTIPVRRVKPAYQESDENYKGQIVGIEYKDAGEKTGAVDVTFDFYVPNDK
ncbi:cell division topological specificity factor homolog, chloroplastic-like [Carex rostrata]